MSMFDCGKGGGGLLRIASWLEIELGSSDCQAIALVSISSSVKIAKRRLNYYYYILFSQNTLLIIEHIEKITQPKIMQPTVRK